MTDLFVTCAAFYPSGEPFASLERSCRRNKLLFAPYGMRQQFTTFLEAKMVHLREFLPTRNERLVLFTDATDSLVLAQQQEITDKWERLGAALMLSTEDNLWPAQDESAWPPSETPWGYLCTFGILGLREALVQVLDRLLGGADLGGYLETPLWQQAYLAGRLPECKLDARCEMFQTVNPKYAKEMRVEPPRIVNSITGTSPCVVHWSRHLEPIAALEERLWPTG